VWLGQWLPTFRTNAMPSSLVFRESKKVKVLRLFETSGTTNPAAQRHISEELTPQQHGCENFVSGVVRAGVVFCVPRPWARFNWPQDGIQWPAIVNAVMTFQCT
jgi:hypothetical protein